MKFFSYPDEVEENRLMWCCGVVKRVKTRDEKVIKVDIKWDENFIAYGGSDRIKDILECFGGILAHRGKGRGGRT